MGESRRRSNLGVISGFLGGLALVAGLNSAAALTQVTYPAVMCMSDDSGPAGPDDLAIFYGSVLENHISLGAE